MKILIIQYPREHGEIDLLTVLGGFPIVDIRTIKNQEIIQVNCYSENIDWKPRLMDRLNNEFPFIDFIVKSRLFLI